MEQDCELGRNDEHLGLVYQNFCLDEGTNALLGFLDWLRLNLLLVNLLIFVMGGSECQKKAGRLDNRPFTV